MRPVAFDLCHDINLCHGRITYSSHLAANPFVTGDITQTLAFSLFVSSTRAYLISRAGKTTCITLL